MRRVVEVSLTKQQSSRPTLHVRSRYALQGESLRSWHVGPLLGALPGNGLSYLEPSG